MDAGDETVRVLDPSRPADSDRNVDPLDLEQSHLFAVVRRPLHRRNPRESFAKAEQDIAVAIEKDPFWAELYALQAVLQDRARKHTDAGRSLKNAHRLAKKTQSAFFDVCEGIMFTRQHNFDGAKSKFRTAAKHVHADSAGNAELALLLVTNPSGDSRSRRGREGGHRGLPD